MLNFLWALLTADHKPKRFKFEPVPAPPSYEPLLRPELGGTPEQQIVTPRPANDALERIKHWLKTN